ncbi:hypothetical protein TI39_contig327g00020 [Zymoseptoria brevis]|uniref:Uncharacterized protein n=1 Tax=Zymoseptoria brevis TaxID=1047168 RepID=A0A0F4GSV2_9PEZI|nr:hypothetical protein TI39_contig327g00020 [Zymoseptoria brevis]
MFAFACTVFASAAATISHAAARLAGGSQPLADALPEDQDAGIPEDSSFLSCSEPDYDDDDSRPEHAVVQTDGRGYVPDGYVLRGTKEMAVRDDEVMEVMEAVEMGMEWVELAGVEEVRVEVAEVVQVQLARARVVEMGVTQVRAVKLKKLSWFPAAARLAVATSVEIQVGRGEMARRGTGVRAATTLTGPTIKPERLDSSWLGVGVGRAEWRRW